MRSTGHGTPEPSEPSWLFQKGNTLGKWRRKPRRMERFIRKVTQDDDIICAFFLAVASGQPIPVRYVEPLPRSEEQLAVARGHATPEQKAMAKKQRRFVVVKRPYYPTPKDWMEAVSWLSDHGLGKAPKKVTIADNSANEPRAVSRKWRPGVDPADFFAPMAQMPKGIVGKAKDLGLAPKKSTKGHKNRSNGSH